MKKLILAVGMVLALTGCAGGQFPPVDYDDLLRSASCINRGIECTIYMQRVFESTEDSFSTDWGNLMGCVDTLAEMKCAEQAAEFQKMISEAMEKND